MSYPHETDGDEMDGLVERPVVSQEATCRECDGDLHQIGSFYACQEVECGRYAVPVNEFGNTDAEQEREDERNGMEQGDGGGSYYSSEAMDAARRID